MNQAEKNKRFLLQYYKEMRKAQEISTEALSKTLAKYVLDQKLIDHITFMGKAFPKYEVIVQEIIAEADKVFLRVEFVGAHKGETEAIPATNQEVSVPFAICYTIKDEMIVDFWAIANEIEFFEQLGISKEQVEVKKSDMNLLLFKKTD